MTTFNMSELREDMNNPVMGFFDEHRWLSNFWPCNIRIYDLTFPSSEHAYVYSKGEFDESLLQKLLESTPGQAKKIGREVTLYDNFDNNRINIMNAILRRKFSDDNPELKRKLIETRQKELVEFNTWGDTFWGMTPDGNGLNNLGKALMTIREDLILSA